MPEFPCDTLSYLYLIPDNFTNPLDVLSTNSQPGTRSLFSFEYSFGIIFIRVSHINNFVEQIKQISKSPTVLDFGKIPYRCDEIMESKADTSEFQNIRFAASISVEKGIQNILQFYREGAL